MTSVGRIWAHTNPYASCRIRRLGTCILISWSMRRIDSETREITESLEMRPAPGVNVSGLESDGVNPSYCGG